MFPARLNSNDALNERLPMTDFAHEPALTVLRLAGAVSGAAVSLVYLLPGSRREAATRFVTGLACGLIFGPSAGLWMARQAGLADALTAHEILLTGSAAASLSAWWVLGALVRVATRWGGPKSL